MNISCSTSLIVTDNLALKTIRRFEEKTLVRYKNIMQRGLVSAITDRNFVLNMRGVNAQVKAV